MMLSCIAAVAIATVVGKKTFESHAYETSNLLMQNVEALSEGAGEYEYPDGYPYSSTCKVAISKWRRCRNEVIICQGGGAGCNSKKCPIHPNT